MPPNRAAWLLAKGQPLTIDEAPYTPPGPNELVIRNKAIAINPVDWAMPTMISQITPWISLPFIIGNDVAGTVHEVGSEVKRFKPGDRVVGEAVGLDKRSKKASEGAFQEYVVLRENLVAGIPEDLGFEQACVLPLALSTAAAGMFQKDYLALQLPTVPRRENNGETLLIWGGSTSVGCNAIQLAVAAGYEVISTASPKNHEYLKSLGASEVFDYRSPTVIDDIVAAFNDKQKIAAGAYAIGAGSTGACIEILSKTGWKKFVAQASYDIELGDIQKMSMLSIIYTMARDTLWLKYQSFVKGVTYKFIWSSDVMANDVGAAIYEHFLPAALASKQFIAAPEAQVAGKGLVGIEEAFNVAKQGVSAKKIVVAL